MGEIVGAGLLSHVPTIVLPDDVRLALNNGRESTLHSGLHRLRREVFDQVRPDLVVVFDSHWLTTVEFVITSHDQRQGFFTSEELPRGMSSVPYAMRGDRAFAHLVGEIADATENCWITPIDNEHLPVTYATVNFLPFLQGAEAWVSVSTCQTAVPADFLLVGEVVRQAIEASDLRVALIASGALSHTFHTLQNVRSTEAADPQYIFSDAAREFDQRVIANLERGDHAAVIDDLPAFGAVKPEGRFAHYLMMAGACGGRSWTTPGVPFSDYENAIGTGQIHLWFDESAA